MTDESSTTPSSSSPLDPPPSSTLGPPPSPRSLPLYPRKKFASAVINRQIYVDGSTSRSSAVEIYDPPSNMWRITTESRVRRYGCFGAASALLPLSTLRRLSFSIDRPPPPTNPLPTNPVPSEPLSTTISFIFLYFMKENCLNLGLVSIMSLEDLGLEIIDLGLSLMIKMLLLLMLEE